MKIKKDYITKVRCCRCNAASGKVVMLYERNDWMNPYDISRSFCKKCLEEGLKQLGD